MWATTREMLKDKIDQVLKTLTCREPEIHDLGHGRLSDPPPWGETLPLK